MGINKENVKTITHKGEKMALSSALPLPIQKAIWLIPYFIATIIKSRPGLVRAMRSDRQECLAKFLKIILLSTSLQHDGAVIYLNENWAKPKTLMEIAEEAGISYSQAKRCLALLKQLGYITSRQIKRKNKINGQLEVSPALRVLTLKFWQAVGLLDLYKASVAWAKKHVKRALYIPFKAVKMADNAIKKVGGLAGDVLKNMFQTAEKEKTEGQKRALYWCDKIRNSVRQNK